MTNTHVEAHVDSLDDESWIEDPVTTVPADSWIRAIDLEQVKTPCHILDGATLTKNGEILADVAARSGATLLLALKAFAQPECFKFLKGHLHGVAASSLHEARLGQEHFGGELHTYAPAYLPDEMDYIAQHATHIVFNSFNQWRRYKGQLQGSQASVGMRINPERSTRGGDFDSCDPCQPGSRMGVPLALFEADAMEGIEGLHFHTLCMQGPAALARTLEAVEARFGHVFHKLKWINFGGGHLITHPNYDRERLIQLIKDFRAKHGLAVTLEPGAGVVFNTDVVVAQVQDIIHTATPNVILDLSAAAHVTDVLDLGWRPTIWGAGREGEYAHTYRLGGHSCLSGDYFGLYSFPEPLQIGQKLVFLDMAHYTLVKMTTFNGLALPTLHIRDL
ncbi:carboxynorspermidine decarboxylase [Magnetococcus marinus MC-1]|uniref:Carboxynorspermidine/carboxyspermidine decarboxylase n=1 Tax=Magnetococcus marinus (strain ATCC BAA-1437 / JCM 17883 / MC-1) TaxID=156889 RepID=A0L6K7_MAGMM|nr:carboxynorspermidine decarboxylase [Magnetococcus marinus]ABK43600.1 carboxynorspermidine decarboxylase [Magnetococcus marinus MC-1]